MSYLSVTYLFYMVLVNCLCRPTTAFLYIVFTVLFGRQYQNANRHDNMENIKLLFLQHCLMKKFKTVETTHNRK